MHDGLNPLSTFTFAVCNIIADDSDDGERHTG